MKLLNSIHEYDVRVFFWFHQARIMQHLVAIFRGLSKTGDGHLYVLLMLLLFQENSILTNPLLKVMLFAFAVERPLYFVLKNGFKRNRPQASLANFKSLIVPSDQFSFPSGHTSAAFMMATLTSHEFPVFMLPLYLWSSLVGMSRVALGVHFFTDILVGATMGILIASFSIGMIY